MWFVIVPVVAIMRASSTAARAVSFMVSLFFDSGSFVFDALLLLLVLGVLMNQVACGYNFQATKDDHVDGRAWSSISVAGLRNNVARWITRDMAIDLMEQMMLVHTRWREVV